MMTPIKSGGKTTVKNAEQRPLSPVSDLSTDHEGSTVFTPNDFYCESERSETPQFIYLLFDCDGALGGDLVYRSMLASDKIFAEDLMVRLLQICHVQTNDKLIIVSGSDRRDKASDQLNVDDNRPALMDVLRAVKPILKTAISRLGLDCCVELDDRFFAQHMFCRNTNYGHSYKQMILSLDGYSEKQTLTKSQIYFSQMQPLFSMSPEQSVEFEDKLDVILGHAWRIFHERAQVYEDCSHVKLVLVDDAFYPNVLEVIEKEYHEKKKADLDLDTMHRLVLFLKESDWLPHSMIFQFVQLSTFELEEKLNDKLSLARKHLDYLVSEMERCDSTMLKAQLYFQNQEGQSILTDDELISIHMQAKTFAVLYKGFFQTPLLNIFGRGDDCWTETLANAFFRGQDYFWKLVLDACTPQKHHQILDLIIKSRYWSLGSEIYQTDCYMDYQIKEYLAHLGSQQSSQLRAEYIDMTLESVGLFKAKSKRAGEGWHDYVGSSSHTIVVHPAPNPIFEIDEFWQQFMFPAVVSYRRYLLALRAHKKLTCGHDHSRTFSAMEYLLCPPQEDIAESEPTSDDEYEVRCNSGQASVQSEISDLTLPFGSFFVPMQGGEASDKADDVPPSAPRI